MQRVLLEEQHVAAVCDTRRKISARSDGDGKAVRRQAAVVVERQRVAQRRRPYRVALRAPQPVRALADTHEVRHFALNGNCVCLGAGAERICGEYELAALNRLYDESKVVRRDTAAGYLDSLICRELLRQVARAGYGKRVLAPRHVALCRRDFYAHVGENAGCGVVVFFVGENDNLAVDAGYHLLARRHLADGLAVVDEVCAVHNDELVPCEQRCCVVIRGVFNSRSALRESRELTRGQVQRLRKVTVLPAAPVSQPAELDYLLRRARGRVFHVG